MSEPVIKVWDILFPRLRVPDLDRMEEFLTEFGMVRADRTSDALYMRGTDAEHHLHVTHRGEPGLIGFGFLAQSLDDLEKRLNVPDLQRAFDWYNRLLGIIPTDSVKIESDIALRFCRCDRGDTYTDHHSFLLVQSQGAEASFNHCSYEVRDIDDVYMGHEHLQQKGYEHWWGIGRHTIGSQVFDYWNSPWGQVHEHYTDGDLLNRDYEATIVPASEIDSQWGPKTPPSVEMVDE
jgi:catechol 2,3-dioxygenase-like lactoylglutathione lyase family enzyme